jgi:hypothetical protein
MQTCLLCFSLIIAYILIRLYRIGKTSAARTKETSEAGAAARIRTQAMRRTGSKGNKRQLNRQAEEAYKAACVDATAWLKVCVYKSLPLHVFPYFLKANPSCTTCSFFHWYFSLAHAYRHVKFKRRVIPNDGNCCLGMLIKGICTMICSMYIRCLKYRAKARLCARHRGPAAGT